MTAHKGRQRVQHLLRLRREVIPAGRNAHVPLRQRIFSQARQRAQHGHVCMLFQSLPQNLFVPRRPHLIEDHARESDALFKGQHAAHQGRRRARHLGAVNADDHRAGQYAGQLRRGARAARVHAVKKAPVALQQAEQTSLPRH